MACVLVLDVAPPWWGRARGVLVGVVAVGILGLMAFALTARAPRTPPSGIRLAPRQWLIGLTTLVILGCGVAMGLIGQDVVPALTLPSAPERASAIRTYRPCVARGCPTNVVFDAAGTRVDTAYAGGLFAMPVGGAGVTFAYDPAAPTHTMPDRDFRFGRGSGLAYAVAALAVLLAWSVGVVVNSRVRTRRGLAALAGAEIADAGMPGTTPRAITFASGARYPFMDTPELDAAIRRRSAGRDLDV